jgi:hypothetical protein
MCRGSRAIDVNRTCCTERSKVHGLCGIALDRIVQRRAACHCACNALLARQVNEQACIKERLEWGSDKGDRLDEEDARAIRGRGSDTPPKLFGYEWPLKRLELREERWRSKCSTSETCAVERTICAHSCWIECSDL